jgi:hypothetical protein
VNDLEKELQIMTRIHGKTITRIQVKLRGGEVSVAGMASGARGGHYTVDVVTRKDGDVVAAMGELAGRPPERENPKKAGRI